MGDQVFLRENHRQFQCESCKKVFSEELEFVKKRRKYTIRLDEKVIQEVLETNGDYAGGINGMTPAETKTLLKELWDRMEAIIHILGFRFLW